MEHLILKKCLSIKHSKLIHAKLASPTQTLKTATTMWMELCNRNKPISHMLHLYIYSFWASLRYIYAPKNSINQWCSYEDNQNKLLKHKNVQRRLLVHLLHLWDKNGTTHVFVVEYRCYVNNNNKKRKWWKFQHLSVSTDSSYDNFVHRNYNYRSKKNSRWSAKSTHLSVQAYSNPIMKKKLRKRVYRICAHK